jgi:hypothetical protein
VIGLRLADRELRLDLEKTFSPMPRTFINSSIFWEDSQLSVYAGELECAHHWAAAGTLGHS